MPKTTAFANNMLLLVFENTALALIGDASGLQPSATAGSLYWSLHTASPGTGGNQTTNETAYTDYARVATARSGAGWTTASGVTSPAANVTFPAGGVGASGTLTYFGLGTASSGAGSLLYFGTITPNITMGLSVQPVLTTASTITET